MYEWNHVSTKSHVPYILVEKLKNKEWSSDQYYPKLDQGILKVIKGTSSFLMNVKHIKLFLHV